MSTSTASNPHALALVECVPNFSEGRDKAVIDAIVARMAAVGGCSMLDVDPGAATNRTVVTMVGSPEAMIEAAFQGAKAASELIDMRKHSGEHARMGALDVCPLIPISGITAEELVPYAERLAERIALELNVPTYLYEAAARAPERRNLADVRAGEYEGLVAKLADANWAPDFGEAAYTDRVAQSGCTVVGVRKFLIAYNINLNTDSTRLANSVAFDVREAGRVLRTGHPVTGPAVLDEHGKEVRVPGTLKSVKAVGWYIPEYQTAQISMNLTDIDVTPLHLAFDAVVASAQSRGLRVTGSELVGLVPLEAMLDAGRHYLRMQKRSEGVSERELVSIAVRSLGLSELVEFVPEKKIIEYVMAKPELTRLQSLTLIQFADETASESPAPGGGSIAAYMGAMGAALTSMVANLSAGKRGWEDKTEAMSEVAVKAQALKASLLQLVDDDTRAFDGVMDAFGLPKGTDAEKAARSAAIQEATIGASRVPLRTLATALEIMPLAEQMIEEGNANSITDAGVAVLAARAAAIGAYLNVKVNALTLKDKGAYAMLMDEADALCERAKAEEARLMARVEAKMMEGAK